MHLREVADDRPCSEFVCHETRRVVSKMRTRPNKENRIFRDAAVARMALADKAERSRKAVRTLVWSCMLYSARPGKAPRNDFAVSAPRRESFVLCVRVCEGGFAFFGSLSSLASPILLGVARRVLCLPF